MTSNQIAYWNLVELRRSNRAKEGLTAEGQAETARSNLAKEAETHRSNVAQESLGYDKLLETQRSNTAKESETYRSNVAKEQETERHNKRTELTDQGKGLTNLIFGGKGAINAISDVLSLAKG